MSLLQSDSLVALIARCGVGLAIAAAISLFGFRSRALDRSGALAASVVGTLAFGFGGLLVASAVVLFFASSSFLARVRTARADRVRAFAAKHGPRDARQVAANGAVATVCAVIGGSIALLHNDRVALAWFAAAVCALAAACGDTWSTDIGAFAPGPPRRITNLQVAVAGSSGAVTALGLIAAPLGGAALGLCGFFGREYAPLAVWILTCGVAALFGSIVDSVLGATVQGTWSCQVCGLTHELAVCPHCRAVGQLTRGFAWLDNDGVNAVTTLCGAIVALAFVAFRYV